MKPVQHEEITMLQYEALAELGQWIQQDVLVESASYMSISMNRKSINFENLGNLR